MESSSYGNCTDNEPYFLEFKIEFPSFLWDDPPPELTVHQDSVWKGTSTKRFRDIFIAAPHINASSNFLPRIKSDETIHDRPSSKENFAALNCRTEPLSLPSSKMVNFEESTITVRIIE